MRLISTRSNASATPEEAVLMGLAPDGGLFVPEWFPTVTPERIQQYADMPFEQISGDILSRFFNIDKADLIHMCTQAYKRFAHKEVVPLHYLGGGLFGMELFHGPTLAFKDVALQLLPLLMSFSATMCGQQQKPLLLVATSGDTGKAALEGFAGKEGTAIIVFYPKDGVSEAQQLQMTTQQGDNVHVVAVEGDFDACQNGVKQLMANENFVSGIETLGYKLSSGNSINFGRLSPQIVYYFSSYAHLLHMDEIKMGEPVDFIIPTGNFGDILAGYYAKRMGLPVGKLICASNSNNVLSRFFETGTYDGSGQLVKTTSPSMDILVSSNLERLLFELSGRDSEAIAGWMKQLNETRQYTVSEDILKLMQEDFYANWSDNDEANEAIRQAYTKRDCLMDPHTAVGLSVYKKYQMAHPNHSRKAVLACTAQAYKFSADVLEALTGSSLARVGERITDALERFTEEPQPSAITELYEMPILHEQSCKPEEMEQYAMQWLQAQR